MADFINFKAGIGGDDEEIGEYNDEISNISDVDFENSFIDNQEVKTDVNFYRHFANVQNDIEQVLKDTYNEALEDIETFDEISNLCEGSEEEPEINNFKNFEVNIGKSNESLFPRVDVEHEKIHNQFSSAILYALRFDKTGLKDMYNKEEFEKVLIKVLLKNSISLKSLNLLLIYKNFTICAMRNMVIF